jgi:hypothetical protein
MKFDPTAPKASSKASLGQARILPDGTFVAQ